VQHPRKFVFREKVAMNSRSDDKIVEQPRGERRSRTVLRLVPRREREHHETEPGIVRKVIPDRRLQHDDDDDPGPTAA
jgi:hypothetical protein